RSGLLADLLEPLEVLADRRGVLREPRGPERQVPRSLANSYTARQERSISIDRWREGRRRSWGDASSPRAAGASRILPSPGRLDGHGDRVLPARRREALLSHEPPRLLDARPVPETRDAAQLPHEGAHGGEQREG